MRNNLNKFDGRKWLDGTNWLIGLACVLFAFLLSAGLYKEMLFLVGAVCGLALFFAGGLVQLYVLAIYSFGIVGPIQYFANLEVQWGAYLIALLLFFSAVLGLVRNKFNKNSGGRGGLIFLWIVLFALFLVVGSLVNNANKYLLLASVRNQFFFLGVSVFIAMGVIEAKKIYRFVSFFDYIVCLQLPLAVYQYLVVVPQRADSVAWDSVVGSFQGRPFSGGDSGGMAFFLVIILLFLIFRYIEGMISLRRLVVVGGFGLATIMLAEVKVVFILFPVGMLLLFWRQLLTNFRFLVSVVLLIVPFLFVMGSLYKLSDGAAGSSSDVNVIERIFKFSTNTDQINRLTGELGRGAALNIWYRDSMAGDFANVLIGHGLGASSASNDVSKGVIALKYFPFLVDNTSVVTLLWDAGLVGLAFYLIFFLYLSFCSRRDLALTMVGEVRALKAFSCLVSTLFIIMMFYNRDGLFASPPVQLILFTAIGIALTPVRSDDGREYA